ncbi:hypothetical protein HY637_00885 [Candidatus Woesearchaeota archaeon]|nr:hypothetical protein [Candidatus Woesearchaeota archaeon]
MLYITYIKKDVNKILLVFIIALLVIFSWSTAYYESKLSNISLSYDNELQKSEKYTGNAVLEDLNHTLSLKNTFQKDKEYLEKGYFDLKIGNDALKAENERLNDEVGLLKAESESQKTMFDKLQIQFKQVQDSLIKANEDISKLIARNNELCRKLREKGEEC